MGYLEKTTTSQTATTNPHLWQKISQFTLDIEGDPLPFSARLARENGWSRQEAHGAIEEYKRFIYLICIADTPLTPSEAVDQVWHLHLVYTRSYWKDFCDGVLGRAIHHDPTKGGESQTRRFVGQYTQTCAIYESEFGSAPPVKFWPPVAERFAASPRLQWVDRRRHWVLRKPEGWSGMLGRASAPLLLLLATTGTLQAEGAKHGSGGGSLWPLIVFGAFIVFGLLSRGSRGKKDNNSGSDSSGWTFSFCGGGEGGGDGGGGDGGGCGGGCGGCGGCGG